MQKTLDLIKQRTAPSPSPLGFDSIFSSKTSMPSLASSLSLSAPKPVDHPTESTTSSAALQKVLDLYEKHKKEAKPTSSRVLSASPPPVAAPPAPEASQPQALPASAPAPASTPAATPAPQPSSLLKTSSPAKKVDAQSNTDFKIETSKLEVDESMLKPARHSEVEQPKTENKAKPRKALEARSQEPTSWQIETTVMDSDEAVSQTPKPAPAKPAEEKALTKKKPAALTPHKEEEAPSFKIETTVATPQMLKRLVGDTTDEEEEIAKKEAEIKKAQEQKLAEQRAESARKQLMSQAGVDEAAMGKGVSGDLASTVTTA